MSIRESILKSIANEPLTADEIAVACHEERKRIVSNLGPMCHEKLCERLSGVNGLVEYKITDSGKAWLARQPGKSTVDPTLASLLAEAKATIEQQKARIKKLEEEASALEEHAEDLKRAGKEWQGRAEQLQSQLDADFARVSYGALELLVETTRRALTQAGVGEEEADNPADAIEGIAKARDEWRQKAVDAEKFLDAETVGYVMPSKQRMVRIGKTADAAQKRAKAACRRSGRNVPVYALVAVGKATPATQFVYPAGKTQAAGIEQDVPT